MRSAPETRGTAVSGSVGGTGVGAVTFLVLLLLVGGVDSRSAQILRGTPVDAVHECVAPAPEREVADERHCLTQASATETLRLVIHSVRPVRTVADAMLPAPRAPDRDQAL